MAANLGGFARRLDKFMLSMAIALIFYLRCEFWLLETAEGERTIAFGSSLWDPLRDLVGHRMLGETGPWPHPARVLLMPHVKRPQV